MHDDEPSSGRLGLDRLAVGDVMTLDPVTIRVDDSVEEAERLLASYRISGLPVIDAVGRLVGVLSRSDLLLEGGPPMGRLLRGHTSGLRVGELMSSPPVTVGLSTSVMEAARMMVDEEVHRLVIVDEHGAPIGVLSATDYVRLVADRVGG